LNKAVEADKLYWHYCDIVPIPDDYDIGEYWEDNNWKYSVKLKCVSVKHQRCLRPHKGHIK
jgi:hypothetical protein